ncbi:MAG: YesL family protein [Clostridia bacterium]|nr:YesL family protein [Clostridia bacterium]
MIANLLYVLVSLPVVTGGLAQAGLTFVTRNYVREKHVFLPSDFFDTIKKNWKQGLLAGILELIVGTIISFSLYFYWMNVTHEDSGLIHVLLFAGAMAVGVIFCFMRYYLYMQLITFKMTMKQLIKNSFYFAMLGIKQNLLISLILVAFYALGIGSLFLFGTYFPVAIILMVLLHVFIFPAFRSFLIQFTIFPLIKKVMIDPYYEEHPDADIEARRNLNLETNEVTESKEEVIFEDRGETAASTEEKEPAIPKQYSAEELRRGKRLQRRDQIDRDDDDGTI